MVEALETSNKMAFLFLPSKPFPQQMLSRVSHDFSLASTFLLYFLPVCLSHSKGLIPVTLIVEATCSTETPVDLQRITTRYTQKKEKKKLRGFSPQVNYTDRAIAAGQRS
jgi:hypothetical protein